MDLKELSAAATPGKWIAAPARLYIETDQGRVEGPVMSYLLGNKASQPGLCVSLASERHADHYFVAYLVNAYRAGVLVERNDAAGDRQTQESK